MKTKEEENKKIIVEIAGAKLPVTISKKINSDHSVMIYHKCGQDLK